MHTVLHQRQIRMADAAVVDSTEDSAVEEVGREDTIHMQEIMGVIMDEEEAEIIEICKL